MQELATFFLKEKAFLSLNCFLLIFLAGCQSEDRLQPVDEKVKAVKHDSHTVVEKETDSKVNSTRVVTQESGIDPVSLSISSIKLEANVIPVGLLEDGTMEVPEDVMKVGWYTNGAKPGQDGNVVLAGHVDNYLGEGIFFDLAKVSVDDEIVISDGENQLTYKVVKKKAYPYKNGPIEEIFGFTSQKRLHLITCTGWFNPFTKNHEERLVVTAIQQ